MNKNIFHFVVVLLVLTATALALGQTETVPRGKPGGKGWVQLIPSNLAGWKYEPEYWKFESGTFHGVTPGTKEHHYAYTTHEYADFELHADVKLIGNNSGVCIRLAPTSFDNVPGYQVDMGEGYWGALWDERGRGMVSPYPKEDAAKLVKQNDWNHYYIRAQGHHIQAWLNGVKTIDVNDEKGRLTGAIGFQLCHGEKKLTDVSFRNVYIRPLAPEPLPATAQTTSPSAPPLNVKLPTLFVVGDSTANSTGNGILGWGDPFVAYFNTAKINVLNRARAGRSSRTIVTEGLWDRVLADMKPGDFVLLQFGHNDGGPLNTDRARGSLPGIGEETKEVVMPSGKNEVVHTYGWYMRKLVNDAKAKRATAIVLSLTVRNIWKEGRVERGSGNFGRWAAEVAASQGVAFIDLTTIVADRYEQLGQEKVKELFGADHTHTSPKGAELNAASVIAGLKSLKKDPLKDLFSAKGKVVDKARSKLKTV